MKMIMTYNVMFIKNDFLQFSNFMKYVQSHLVFHSHCNSGTGFNKAHGAFVKNFFDGRIANQRKFNIIAQSIMLFSVHMKLLSEELRFYDTFVNESKSAA